MLCLIFSKILDLFPWITQLITLLKGKITTINKTSYTVFNNTCKALGWHELPSFWHMVTCPSQPLWWPASWWGRSWGHGYWTGPSGHWLWSADWGPWVLAEMYWWTRGPGPAAPQHTLSGRHTQASWPTNIKFLHIFMLG